MNYMCKEYPVIIEPPAAGGGDEKKNEGTMRKVVLMIKGDEDMEKLKTMNVGNIIESIDKKKKDSRKSKSMKQVFVNNFHLNKSSKKSSSKPNNKSTMRVDIISFDKKMKKKALFKSTKKSKKSHFIL